MLTNKAAQVEGGRFVKDDTSTTYYYEEFQEVKF